MPPMETTRRAGAGLDPTQVAPGTTSLAPGFPVHWGVPAPVAPPPPTGRRWVTVPVALAAVAVASAEPVVGVLGLGLVGGPALATLGDALAQPQRNQAWTVAWWFRNLGVGLVRSLGGLVVLAVTVCLWFGARAVALLEPAAPWTLRLGGGLAGALVVMAIGRGGPGYRAEVTLDAVVARLVPRGRPTVAAAVTVLVCVAVACLALLLRPEAWPIR